MAGAGPAEGREQAWSRVKGRASGSGDCAAVTGTPNSFELGDSSLLCILEADTGVGRGLGVGETGGFCGFCSTSGEDDDSLNCSRDGEGGVGGPGGRRPRAEVGVQEAAASWQVGCGAPRV